MKAVAYTAVIIAALIGTLVLAFAACIWIGHYLQTHRIVRLMRQRGRLLSRADFEQHLTASVGTVFFEYPTLGWRFFRVWWTPDDVRAHARSAGISEHSPNSPSTSPSPFEIWCHDSYTDLQSGHAFLVPLYLFGSANQRFWQSLHTRFPNMNSAFVYSALIHFTRTYESPRNT